ncbi:hypothetical protein ACVWY2_006162 [Bradyrhizobium sp. JR6.1]
MLHAGREHRRARLGIRGKVIRIVITVPLPSGANRV